MKRDLTIRLRIPGYKTTLIFLWFLNIYTLSVVRFLLVRVGINEGPIRTAVLWLAATIPFIGYLIYLPKIGFSRFAPFFLLFLVIATAWGFTALTNPAAAVFLVRDTYGPERFFRPDAPLFAFLFFLMFDDPKELHRDVTSFAYLYFFYEVVVSLIPAMLRGYWINVGPSGEELHSRYSLSFGYAMCFPTIVFMHNAIRKKNLFHIVAAVAGVICIVLNGNRGALLLPIIFVALMVHSGIVQGRSVSKKALKITLILFFCAGVLFFGEWLLRQLASMLVKAGISSRSLNMILEGSITDENGREIIWQTVIAAIKKGNILGYGVYGDRPFVFPVHYVGYSHNLFLELIVSFGAVGVLIILWIIGDAVYMFFFCRDRDWRELYMIFFAISCQLMLSLSFWYVWEFWAAVAIAFRYRWLGRRKTRFCGFEACRSS